MTASLHSNQQPLHRNTSKNVVLAGQRLHPLAESSVKTPLRLVRPEGQFHVHTAPYRGSFSIVLSEALRTAGLGSRVIVAQFLKGGVDQGPEGSVNLCGKLKWLRPSIDKCLEKPASLEFFPTNSSNPVEDIWEVCKKHIMEGDVDKLVLDELGLAISLGYLEEKTVVSSLKQRSGFMDVILTGPSIPPPLLKMADQVTELRNSF